MTEPVAYLVSQEPLSSVSWLSDVKPIGVDNKQITPLYTAEQLQPRVKMTQAEFDEWHKLVEEVADLYTAVTEICDISHYPNLYFRFFDLHNDDTDKTRKTQVEFATLWGIFDEFNPEETIEIVPDMKWFVRSNEPDDDLRDFIFLSGSNLDDLDYLVFDYAKAFETKEEAERWTNPLTETVQLPVEEK